MIDEQLRQQLRDLVERPTLGGVFLFDGSSFVGREPPPIRDDFTIGYRCTGFQFDLASTLNKALILFVWAGTINMPFMRRLKSVGQATVILLALGPFLPLSFFSEVCEAAIERLSKTNFGKACINASERLALYYGRQELL